MARISKMASTALGLVAISSLLAPTLAMSPATAAVAAVKKPLVIVVPLVGDTGPSVRQLQSQLKLSGIKTTITGVYDAATETSVEHYQWKYGYSETGQITRGQSRKLAALAATSGQTLRCSRSAHKVLCGDQTQLMLRYYVNGKLRWAGDARYKTLTGMVQTGRFKVQAHEWDDWSSLYNVWMPRSLAFNNAQKIHYSPIFHEFGYDSASHGCVGLWSLKSTTQLYRMVANGTPVWFYRPSLRKYR